MHGKIQGRSKECCRNFFFLNTSIIRGLTTTHWLFTKINRRKCEKDEENGIWLNKKEIF